MPLPLAALGQAISLPMLFRALAIALVTIVWILAAAVVWRMRK